MALAGCSGLQKSLQIPVGPLAKGTLLPHDTLGLERFAEIGYDQLPFMVSKASIEFDCSDWATA